jgi:hypothetical protein
MTTTDTNRTGNNVFTICKDVNDRYYFTITRPEQTPELNTTNEPLPETTNDILCYMLLSLASVQCIEDFTANDATVRVVNDLLRFSYN